MAAAYRYAVAMRTPLPALAGVAVAASLLLAGCSTAIPEAQPTSESQDSEASDAPSTDLDVEPAAGETITGSGYTYVAPEGWGVPTESVPGFTPDTLVANLQDTDGFADNLNTLKSPAGVVTPDVVESAGVDELEGVGATEVTVNDRVTVAGTESAHLSAMLASGGTSYAVEQYYVSDADQTFVVTFSFSDTVPADERVRLAESVLVTWTWA